MDWESIELFFSSEKSKELPFPKFSVGRVSIILRQ